MGYILLKENYIECADNKKFHIFLCDEIKEPENKYKYIELASLRPLCDFRDNKIEAIKHSFLVLPFNFELSVDVPYFKNMNNTKINTNFNYYIGIKEFANKYDNVYYTENFTHLKYILAFLNEDICNSCISELYSSYKKYE